MFCHPHNERYAESGSRGGLADIVCPQLIASRTDLPLVDEIHNLNLATSAGEDMSDYLGCR